MIVFLKGIKKDMFLKIKVLDKQLCGLQGNFILFLENSTIFWCQSG